MVKNGAPKIGVLVLIMLLGTCTFMVEAGDIRIVTTFPILADFAQEVGGDRADVISLVPIGADPHSWEPTPRDARSVASAHIVFSNGGGFDAWLDRLISNAASPDTPVVVLSEGLVPLAGGEHNHGHEHEGDPHFWLSVPNAIYYVERMAAALSALVPENEEYFQERAADYIQKLEELDAWLLTEISKIPPENRVLVTYHNAFSYLADRYGFSVVEFLVHNPQSEPTARDMVEMVKLLSSYNKPVVFMEPQISSGHRYAEALTNEVGGSVRILYSDSLTQDVSSYLDMMYLNGKTLVEALQ